MKKFLIIAVVVFLAQPQSLFAQLVSHKGLVPNGYNFWVYKPNSAASDTTKMPLIIFLHGRSLCGSNLETVRRYGPLDALEYGRQINAIILAPQNPGSSWQPSKIKNVLDWTEKEYPVDTSRVYVFGMSLGGYGTIDFVGTYPDKVAAAIAMCGGGTIKDYSGLSKVPLWIIHGTADTAVPYKESQKVVNAIKSSGTSDNLRFDLINGASHSKLGRVFYMKEPYQWLLSHSLSDSLSVNLDDITITSSGMDNAYKGMPGRRSLSVKSYSSSPSVAVDESDFENVGNVDNGDDEEVKIYIIKKGDTLSKIAKSNGVTVNYLCKKNGLTKSSVLKIGKRIVL